MQFQGETEIYIGFEERERGKFLFCWDNCLAICKEIEKIAVIFSQMLD